jgi:single-stranded-DNA-specific exonuclease
VRSARDIDLIKFLASHAPPDADSGYGHGHRAATGGALRPETWNEFVSDLGFGIEDHVR